MNAVMETLQATLLMFSVLVPTRLWYAPGQPLWVTIDHPQAVQLVLTDGAGRSLEPAQPPQVASAARVDVAAIYPQTQNAGTYLLWAVPPGGSVSQFIGTPLVIQARADRRRDSAPGTMVLRVQPLRYAVIQTQQGGMTVAFYLQAAPNTVENFLSLADQGYYDGLKFHRIVPNFVVQGGDPRGDGSGGPGYTIDAEFNDREHVRGVLSMARMGDPLEAQGQMPRPEWANSAGSQFFICLNEANTRRLDRRYTAFGIVVNGLEVLDQLGATPVQGDRPANPPVIERVVVRPVRPGENPYESLLVLTTSPAATQAAPATPQPAGR